MHARALHVCSYVQGIDIEHLFLSLSALIFKGEISQWSSILLFQLDLLAREVLGFASLQFLSAGVKGAHHHTWVLCGCRGSKLGFPCMPSQGFTHWAGSVILIFSVLTFPFHVHLFFPTDFTILLTPVIRVFLWLRKMLGYVSEGFLCLISPVGPLGK